jgi:hypothetical protein
MTLASRLGTTVHLSPLLMKARRLGLGAPGDLERLAVKRGLRYYDSHGDSQSGSDHPPDHLDCASEEGLTNEELSIALLSLTAPYSQQRLRMGAAMLAADGNSPDSLAALALRERCGTVVRHIAECGRDVEPANPFWTNLLKLLPDDISASQTEALPHPSRFVAMTGLTRHGSINLKQWIRPRKTVTQ